MKGKFLRLTTVLLVIAVCAGCQRMHTETGGGSKAKGQPQYDEKLQKPDPNLPGNAQ